MLPVASTLVTMLVRSVVSVWRQCHCAIVVVQSRPATVCSQAWPGPSARGLLASGLHAEVDPTISCLRERGFDPKAAAELARPALVEVSELKHDPMVGT